MEPVEAAGVLVGGLRGGPGVGRGDAELLDASRGGEGQDGGDEFVPRAEGEEHFRGEVAAGLHVEGERRSPRRKASRLGTVKPGPWDRS